MPNGFHGASNDWNRIEAPLRILDPILREFGRSKGLAMVSNERNWPDRSYRWGERPHLLIQLYLESEKELNYTLWVSAYDHRSREEYWKHETILKAASINDLKENLLESLTKAYAKASVWVKEYNG